VTDLLTADEVEDRLRRCLADRAEAMALGDGAPWDPTATGPGALDDLVAGRPGHRSRRPLVAAAAVAVVAAGVAGALALGGDEGPTEVSSGAAPTTTASSPAGPTTTGTAPALLPSLVAGYQQTGVAPSQEVWLYLTWYPKPDMAATPIGPSEDITVDGHRARVEQVLPDYPSARTVWVFYDDGVLGIHAGGIDRAEVLAVAASVHRHGDRTAFDSTPPPGWYLAAGPRPPAPAAPAEGPMAEALAKLKDAAANLRTATTTVPATTVP
jgi:hypothetical protein